MPNIYVKDHFFFRTNTHTHTHTHTHTLTIECIALSLKRPVKYWIILSVETVTHQGAMERRLLNDLFTTGTYNKLERPVLNESDALTVKFGLTIQQIIDVVSTKFFLVYNSCTTLSR